MGCNCSSAESINDGKPACSDHANKAPINGFVDSGAGQVCIGSCHCTGANGKVASPGSASDGPAALSTTAVKAAQSSSSSILSINPSDYQIDPGTGGATILPGYTATTTSLPSIAIATAHPGNNTVCPKGPLVDPNITNGTINLYCTPSNATIWVKATSNFNTFSASLCEQCPNGYGPDPACLKQPTPLPGPCCRKNGFCWYAGTNQRYGTGGGDPATANVTANNNRQHSNITITETGLSPCSPGSFTGDTALVDNMDDYYCALAVAEGVAIS
ncbi:MAG: hypothetical protein M1824_004581 [Vezdaea acicularis]|nr:MAG: hypothetical protein M1824_004581 [Vezdaea acicularis]